MKDNELELEIERRLKAYLKREGFKTQEVYEFSRDFIFECLDLKPTPEPSYVTA